MSTQPPDPEIILYDLACTKNVCFSPVVWRIRLMLNYKKIPYKTIFLEFPDIEPTLKSLSIPTPTPPTKYTVPTITHLPSATTIMDSLPIANFLETTYPLPALPLSSPLGIQIETQARTVLGPVFRKCIMPREIHILAPRAAEYFRRTREEALGRRLEDVEREGDAWGGLAPALQSISDLLQTNHASGPFILGAQPSMTDFFIVGSMQTARMVDVGVWERMAAVEGLGRLYEAVEREGWLGRRD